tara:strand:+ start:27687 stop:29921 length:2235 start_codon:yes stop_codon:yes gene_type:complete
VNLKEMRLIFILSFLSFSILKGQEDSNCGTKFEHQKKNISTNNKIGFEKYENILAETILKDKSKKSLNKVLKVPVVFHILHRDGINIGEKENYSEETVLDILKNCNDAFRKKKDTYWFGEGVDTKIEFVLASLDPDGNETNGIVRVNGSHIDGFNEYGYNYSGNSSPKTNDITGLSWWPMRNYVNIYVIHKISGAGGVSFGSGVIQASRPLENMNYSTYVHELGHHFSLYHTFNGGCSETDCQTQGDRVCDTPPTEAGNLLFGLNFFCTGGPTCGTNDSSLVRNFMDYGDLSCHNMFTQGQADRMRAELDTTKTSRVHSELTTVQNLIKTGCYNNVKPRSLFSPGHQTVCIEDTVHFRNISTRNPKSYEWIFENGFPSKSTAETPDVYFTKSGNNKVTLICTNDNGSDTSEQYITVVSGTIPETKDSYEDSGENHHLIATTSDNSIINWYDSDSSNLIINVGDTLLTGPITNTKSFYAQSWTEGETFSIGEPDIGDSRTSSNDGNVYFTVKKSLLLKSIDITFGKRVRFYLRDMSGRIIQEFRVFNENYIDDLYCCKSTFTVNINLKLNPGKYYWDLYYSHDPDDYWIYGAYMSDYDGDWPIVHDLLDITGTTRTEVFQMYNYYSFYYNWKVQELKCKSIRVKVDAKVKGDIASSQESNHDFNLEIYPNPVSDKINLSFNSINNRVKDISIYNIYGALVKKTVVNMIANGNNQIIIDTSKLESGNYIISLNSDEGIKTIKFCKK